MPRGKPRKPSVEILPPEENSQPMREVKHTAQWVEIRPAEDAPDEDAELDFEEGEEGRPKRKLKNAREELRKKLRAQGVAPSTNLRLYIEKYLHSDSNASGSYAETEFCTKYETTEDHILNKDYIDVARRWGHGKYRITIRMQNKIVDAFDERISAAPNAGPVIQQVNPSDPNSPQFIIQTNGDGQQQQQPPSMRDIMKAQKEAFKEQLEMAKLMREAYGFGPEPAPSATTTDPELAALQLIAKNPDVMEKLGSGIAKTVLGGKAGGDEDPWASVAMELVKSGQAAQVVRELVNGIFNGFGGLFPGRQNNGQAEMAQAPVQAPHMGNSQHPQQSPNQVGGQLPQTLAQGTPSAIETGAHASTELSATAPQQVAPQDPYAQMLTGVITTLINNGPVEDAVKRVDGFLLLYPAYTETIDAQFSQPAETLLGAISTIPGCEQIAQAEHAKQWVENFQAKFFAESQEGEE